MYSSSKRYIITQLQSDPLSVAAKAPQKDLTVCGPTSTTSSPKNKTPPKHLFQILEDKPFSFKCTIATIDVKALYLNIPHKEGIQAVLDRAYYKNADSKNMKLPPETLQDLLKIVLTHIYFEFAGHMYHQIQGRTISHGCVAR